MKNKGFTLIEIIAVIIILGVICLIVLPNVNAVVESGKKNTLKATANNILNVVKQECEVEKMDNDVITKSYTITDGELSTPLEVDNLPESGIISVTDNCQATVAVTDHGYCAIAGVGETIVNTNVLHCGGEYSEVPKTENSCFIFDEETKTITGYDFENEKCSTEISIPATINDIPVEHIADYAFRNNFGNSVIAYFANGEEGWNFSDLVTDNFEKFTQSYELESISTLVPIVDEPKKNCILKSNTTKSADFGASEILSNENAAKYLACGLLASDFEYSNMLGVITKVNFRSATNLKTIGIGAFIDNRITNVYFGENNSLTSIGMSAFGNNLISGELDLSNLNLIDINGFSSNNITSLILPDSVKEISNSAFMSNSISELVLGDNVETIGIDAFYGNNISGNYEIPSSITTIKSYAFGSNEITSLVIGETLSKISDFAFYYNRQLANVEFGSNIEEIGYGAFAYTSISSPQFPENLKKIGPFAFSSDNISEITFPENIEVIGQGAFQSNTATIDTVIIPDSLTSISEAMFSQTKINNLVIGDNVITVGKGAFNRSGIKTIDWGDSITKIKNCAFCYCNLETFSLPPNLNSIEGNAFLYAFQNIDNETITIPDAITRLEYTTFQGLSGPNLTTINTGANVTVIDQNVFNSLRGSKLEKVIIGSKVTSINGNAFACNDASKCDYTFEIDQVEGTLSGFPWGNNYASVIWNES